jgi:endonuclease/exonuclease/phosphatase family metal-dependent hydrolase
MPKFLFWNVARKPLQNLIAAIAESHDIDVLILAECRITPSALLRTLNHAQPSYQYAFGYSENLLFFTKFHAGFLRPVFESSRISIRRLSLPARKEILIAAAHLPSRMHFSEDSLQFECIHLAGKIEEQERIAGHKRTVVLGDLNVNPFEKGVVAAGGLHAVMSREVASRGRRTVQGREYDFFYNPMWSHFGDLPNEPAGTYYYEKAEPVNYFWHIFDQVLIRPELLENFGIDHVQVLTAAGHTPLLDANGRPDRNRASDHLPLVLELYF